MTVHVIKDESIGGLLREYTEVERKAEAGDYVVITRFDVEEVSEIRKIVRLSEYGVEDFYIDKPIGDETYFDADVDGYVSLAPTDIVYVDGTRYRLVERKAEVGEKVVVVKDDETIRQKHIGEIHTVTYNDGNLTYTTGKWDDGSVLNLIREEYRVLEELKSRHQPQELTLDEREIRTNPRKVIDMLAHLAQTVSRLERTVESLESQLKDTQGNVETIAQETASNTHVIDALKEALE